MKYKCLCPTLRRQITMDDFYNLCNKYLKKMK